MCHTMLEVPFGPNVNFIIGRNGSELHQISMFPLPFDNIFLQEEVQRKLLDLELRCKNDTSIFMQWNFQVLSKETVKKSIFEFQCNFLYNQGRF